MIPLGYSSNVLAKRNPKQAGEGLGWGYEDAFNYARRIAYFRGLVVFITGGMEIGSECRI
jgi:hypothetical protein